MSIGENEVGLKPGAEAAGVRMKGNKCKHNAWAKDCALNHLPQ